MRREATDTVTRPSLVHHSLLPALHSIGTAYPRMTTLAFGSSVTQTHTGLQSSVSAVVHAPGSCCVTITVDNQYQWESIDDSRETGNLTEVARWMCHLTRVVACPPQPPPIAVWRSGKESIAGAVCI